MHAVMAGGFATVAGNFTDMQFFHVKQGFSCSPSVHDIYIYIYIYVCVCVCVCVCLYIYIYKG